MIFVLKSRNIFKIWPWYLYLCFRTAQIAINCWYLVGHHWQMMLVRHHVSHPANICPTYVQHLAQCYPNIIIPTRYPKCQHVANHSIQHIIFWSMLRQCYPSIGHICVPTSCQPNMWCIFNWVNMCGRNITHMCNTTLLASTNMNPFVFIFETIMLLVHFFVVCM